MNENTLYPHRVDAFGWEGKGYRPLVSCRDWLVALMNWEPRFDLAKVGQVERHNRTDEVFVLTHGRGVLYVDKDGSIELIDMRPGVLYNVTAGTWHSVIGNRESSWLIVESNDTSADNTDYRQLSERELITLKEQYPDWLVE